MAIKNKTMISVASYINRKLNKPTVAMEVASDPIFNNISIPTNTKYKIPEVVAVLGAGVMGSQIAAIFANMDIQILLYDINKPDVKKTLLKMEPAPLLSKLHANNIKEYSFDTLEPLKSADLIIEAIVENLDIKKKLYTKIVPSLKEDVIFTSNTSGLSITELSNILPKDIRSKFLGMHFFNPPRYMKLIELVASPYTDESLLDFLEDYLTHNVGKNVVRALDTPNFVANRLGIVSMLITVHHTLAFNLPFEVVDALTGMLIGRPKSATYGTLDLVGIDIFSNTIKTMREGLPTDPWHKLFTLPDFLQNLLDKGMLGRKTGAGIYKKVGKEILVLNLAKGEYVPQNVVLSPFMQDFMKDKSEDKWLKLYTSKDPQAQFLWCIFRDMWHYGLYHLENMAHNARDVDQAMKWGFGWYMGPFELWNKAGGKMLAMGIVADNKEGKTILNAHLPEWVFNIPSLHTAEGSFNAKKLTMEPRSLLPIYNKQLLDERLLGEAKQQTTIIWENDVVKLFTLPQVPDVGVLSIKGIYHTLGFKEIESVIEAVQKSEEKLAAMVLWQPAPFSLGANLKEVLTKLDSKQFDAAEKVIKNFQTATRSIKYSKIPIVAACEGLALGGGCEFLLACTSRVLAQESYIGLVEAGVGLLPAGGGSYEMALYVSDLWDKNPTMDPWSIMQPIFERIALAKVSKSAFNAQEMGYVQPTDTILWQPKEILFAALVQAKSLAMSGYIPKKTRILRALGRMGVANAEGILTNLKKGGFISEHDYIVGKSVAIALCGGEIDFGTTVNEEWVLNVERAYFINLLKTEKTLERMKHTMQTGKPLRN